MPLKCEVYNTHGQYHQFTFAMPNNVLLTASSPFASELLANMTKMCLEI